MFITIEGTDGAGKTTQLELLQAHLTSLGHEVVVVREPGGTGVGEDLRAVIKQVRDGAQKMSGMARLLAFNAARAQLVETVIAPALNAGKIVIADRFTDSSIAYQGYADGIDLTVVREICHAATAETYVDGLIPDLTLYMRVSEEVRNERIGKRGEAADAIELEGDAYFQAVIRGFDHIAQDDPERVKVIDANRTPEQVHEQVLAVLAQVAQERGIDLAQT